jgi:hypothetical protein
MLLIFMTHIPSFIKICSGVQKFIWKGYTHRHTGWWEGFKKYSRSGAMIYIPSFIKIGRVFWNTGWKKSRKILWILYNIHHRQNPFKSIGLGVQKFIWKGYTHRHTGWWEGFMMYAADIVSGAMIHIPSFIKIGSGIQKSIEGIHRHTDRMWSHKPTFIFFEIRKKIWKTHSGWCFSRDSNRVCPEYKSTCADPFLHVKIWPWD